MKYKILKNIQIGKSTGALVDRAPFIITDRTVNIEFDEHAEGYTAIFSRNGYSFYQKIIDGKCEVSSSAFKVGETTNVSLSKLDARAPIICEGIIPRYINGNVVLFPDDGDIPARFSEMLIVYDDLARRFTEIESRFIELNARVEEINGHDIY